MMGKIIKFPGRTEPVKQEVDGFYESEVMKAFVDDYVEQVGHGLIEGLHQQGFDVDNDEFIITFMYAMETMKASLCINKGIEHPLSSFVGRRAPLYFKKMNKESENE